MAKTILVLSANPKNTPQLRLDQEVREIENGLERAHRRDEFILKQKWATRPVDARRAMLDFKPNIVHFCGHGSGEEGITFEDETGQAKLVNADTLASFFELFADKLECVVLNACYSEVQAEAVAKHIPYVIGMNKAIRDTAAIEFSVAFYDAFGAGRSIEFAYKLACNAIQWSSMTENLTTTLKSKTSVEPMSEGASQEKIRRENERRDASQNEYILRNLEQSLDFPIEFRVETPEDGQVVRMEDCPLSASGTYGSEKKFHAWVILDDKRGNFYLQNPPIRLLSKNLWKATNICAADPEIEHIHFIYVDEQGHSQFLDMVHHSHFGAFYELPPNSKILRTISIKMATN